MVLLDNAFLKFWLWGIFYGISRLGYGCDYGITEGKNWLCQSLKSKLPQYLPNMSLIPPIFHKCWKLNLYMQTMIYLLTIQLREQLPAAKTEILSHNFNINKLNFIWSFKLPLQYKIPWSFNINQYSLSSHNVTYHLDWCFILVVEYSNIWL